VSMRALSARPCLDVPQDPPPVLVVHQSVVEDPHGLVHPQAAVLALAAGSFRTHTRPRSEHVPPVVCMLNSLYRRTEEEVEESERLASA